MKINLVSDFEDFYDEFFDGEGEIFRRVTTDGLNRSEMLEYLKKLKFTVPKFGSVKQLSEQLEPNKFIVLHHNINAHRGEGKELATLANALVTPNIFATEFIQHDKGDSKGLSWRYLQIGKHSYWLEYSNANDWRSNYGDAEVKLIFRDKTELVPKKQYDLMMFKCPLFAIDFIPRKKKLYAVDFNIAPGCDPIKGLISPKEAAESIKEAYRILKKEYD